MRLEVFRADPAGNITLFVLTPVEKARRAAVAAALMARAEYGAEQVGFVCETDADGGFEMMGGEFCGNATRAYGAYLAEKLGKTELSLRVSGCDHPVRVSADGGEAWADMPLPCGVRSLRVGETDGTLVDLGGIVHFVAEHAPSEAFFAAAEEKICAGGTPEAYGVMFLDSAAQTLAPLVKVAATDTLVWEGSCGSGTLAAACAQSEGVQDGVFCRSYRQRAGTVTAEVTRRGGQIVGARIGGAVTIGAPFTVEV